MSSYNCCILLCKLSICVRFACIFCNIFTTFLNSLSSILKHHKEITRKSKEISFISWIHNNITKKCQKYFYFMPTMHCSFYVACFMQFADVTYSVYKIDSCMCMFIFAFTAENSIYLLYIQVTLYFVSLISFICFDRNSYDFPFQNTVDINEARSSHFIRN